MINRQRLTAALLALVVLASGLSAFAGPAAAATYSDGDEAIAVIVEWDDVEVSDGDTADIQLEHITTGDADTVTVTVRDATGEDTYWINYDDLSIDPADAEDVDISLVDDILGVIVEDFSVSYDGSETLEVADNEGIETNLTAIDAADAPLEVDVAVYDGETLLNSTTVDVSGGETVYADIDPVDLEGDTANVTVQIDNVFVDSGSDGAYPELNAFSAEIIDDGGAGGGSDGGTDDQTMWIIGGAIALLGALLLMND
ncbi:hypothetical protein SAMN05444422_1033 [Halobiforma haloterrestris]|uniref:PGF-CTERM protein n=1 Tax=Natronobacterium haloterrestre TaxID=148448 RepID=A0A1I1F2Q8_NATHA|nr:hypothetical protein [Halobiforma haloterrestris]SFB91450.1 hypothetical protein SAMN05444422_1033 [Halobiforma haloterrestris]